MPNVQKRITPLYIKEARRKRLKKAISDLHDLRSDKYIRTNQIGKIECRICFTTHNNESSYIIHRSSIRHQLLAEKQFKKERALTCRPRYKMYNVMNETHEGFLVKIKTRHTVLYRVLKALEQNVEPVNLNYNYLVFSVKGFDNIGLRIPLSDDYKTLEHFDGYSFKLQILYKKRNDA